MSMGTIHIFKARNDPCGISIRAIKLAVLWRFPLPKREVRVLGLVLLVVSICVLYTWNCFSPNAVLEALECRR